MSTFKAMYQKYLDKLKGVDLTSKATSLSSEITSCVSSMSNLKSSISSSTWTELGEQSLANSVIPSVQTATSGLSSNINVLGQASSKSKELVDIIEQLKKACEEYDNLKLEDYAYTDSDGNKRYHQDQYDAKKAELKRAYEELESKADAKIKEINGLTVTDLKISISDLFAAEEPSTEVVSDEEFSQIVSQGGGQYVENVSKGISGYIVSSLDGKRHIIFRQSQISGWGTNCNRAAAASIASAFTNNPWDAVKIADQVGNGIGYSARASQNYFSRFGLTANVKSVRGSYDRIKDELLYNVKKGNYVMFDLDDSHVKGRSGQVWTSTRHWLAVLDVKKVGNGPNDYAIFISDSGHSGSRKDYYGYGKGWYRLDEFSGLKVANFTTISDTRRKT